MAIAFARTSISSSSGVHPSRDLGDQLGRVGPGGVLVRVVGFEHELLDADLVASVDADHVVEEAAEHPAGHLRRRERR